MLLMFGVGCFRHLHANAFSDASIQSVGIAVSRFNVYHEALLEAGGALEVYIMKKWLIFVLGIVTGVIITLVFLLVISKVYSVGNQITVSRQQTEFTLAKRFEVFQVLDGGALANCEDDEYSNSVFTGPVVYILMDDGDLFYDDQIIEVPEGKKVIQIGTYRYETRMGEKVVPALKFL